MARLILDCDLMKYPFSGLYQYCHQLTENVNIQLEKSGQAPMYQYLPPRGKLVLPMQSHHLIERKWHRLIAPFMRDCKVWHAPFQSGRIVPIKQKFPNLKVVLTLHDLNVLHEGKPEEDQQKSLAHTQSLIDRSDALVCISKFTKNDVLDHCHVGNKPIHVIYNGVDPVPAAVTAAPDYRPTRPFLLGIGYLNAKKNFHVLVPLLKANPDLELILIGRHDDPDYVAQLQQQAQTVGVHDRLQLLGTVSEADKGWYLRNCQALVHPSLAEGFGLPVLEAMQFGKPVFLSTRTALPEIGGDAAYYFPDFTADTLQTVYREGMIDYARYARADSIRQHAARFNWQITARQYVAVYEELGL